jgi:hypothetical protein
MDYWSSESEDQDIADWLTQSYESSPVAEAAVAELPVEPVEGDTPIGEDEQAG